MVRAIRDSDGEAGYFSIEHVSPAFHDPAARREYGHRPHLASALLEAYPGSVTGSGLFARARQVLAGTG